MNQTHMIILHSYTTVRIQSKVHETNEGTYSIFAPLNVRSHYNFYFMRMNCVVYMHCSVHLCGTPAPHFKSVSWRGTWMHIGHVIYVCDQCQPTNYVPCSIYKNGVSISNAITKTTQARNFASSSNRDTSTATSDCCYVYE